MTDTRNDAEGLGDYAAQRDRAQAAVDALRAHDAACPAPNHDGPCANPRPRLAAQPPSGDAPCSDCGGDESYWKHAPDAGDVYHPFRLSGDAPDLTALERAREWSLGFHAAMAAVRDGDEDARRSVNWPSGDAPDPLRENIADLFDNNPNAEAGDLLDVIRVWVKEELAASEPPSLDVERLARAIDDIGMDWVDNEKMARDLARAYAEGS